MPFVMGKLEWLGYPMAKNVSTEFANVTDTHRDTAWQHRPRLHSIAWQKLQVFAQLCSSDTSTHRTWCCYLILQLLLTNLSSLYFSAANKSA